MRIAFYKGRSRIFNRFVSWWTRGPYSHCEAVFDREVAPGLPICASSSFMDGGVRFKAIELAVDYWDIIDVPAFDEERARAWFVDHIGDAYDAVGLLSTSLPIRDFDHRWFCNEAVGAAAGLLEPWRFNPNSFSRICELAGGRWIQGGPDYKEPASAGIFLPTQP
jgi:hypothetical protein